MTKKLNGFLFPNMQAMREAINKAILEACKDVPNKDKVFKKFNVYLAASVNDDRCDGSERWLDKNPTLQDIIYCLEQSPKADEICLNIDICTYSSMADLRDNVESYSTDTGVDVWKNPNQLTHAQQ